MVDAVNASGNADIDGILWGYRWSGSSLTYSFPVNSTEYTNSGYTSVTGFQTLNAAQRLAVIGLLEGPSSIESGNSIESFTNLTFTFVLTPSATLRFGNATSVDYTNDSTVATHTGDHVPGNGGTAEANPPESAFGGVAPFSPGYAQGDTWLTAGAYNNPTLGSFQYTAGIMHEIGHNLGLKHGQITQAKHGTTFPTLPANHDSQEYSVMTYNQYVGDTSAASNLPEAPTTYMQDDIAALQYLYGANYGSTAHNTDTVYQWSQTTGEEFINGVGMGTPQGIRATSGNMPNPTTSVPVSNWILMTVWDGGGTDTYNFSNFTSNLQVDLNPGAWTITDPNQLADLGNDLAGGPEHYARGNIANALIDPNNPSETASLIENAIGGSGNDTMIGNAANNALTGNAGNDTFDGGLGIDTLVGGLGDDIYYLNDATFVFFGYGATYVYDTVVEAQNGGTDTVYVKAIDTFNHLYQLPDNVENGTITGTFNTFSLTGNALDNILTGNVGSNTLDGGAGNDTLAGGLGNDQLIGGPGFDVAVFSHARSTYSVSHNGAGLTVSGPDGTDTLSTIERLLFSDTSLYVTPRPDDFDGNGTGDVMLRNKADGRLWINTYNGTVMTGGGPAGSPSTDWDVVATGDFNSDGHTDVALRNHATGQLWFNFYNGVTIAGSGPAGSPTTDWDVAGTGDFNGDGYSDMLLRNHASGALWINLYNGVNIIGSGPAGSPTTDWDVAGIGDFNADGFSDVLLHNHNTGQLYINLYNGLNMAGSGPAGSPTTDWDVGGVGDFNGDGNADVLLHNHNTGQLYINLYNGLNMAGSGAAGSPSTDWDVARVADYNSDGFSDVMLRNHTSGALYVDLYNGLNMIGSGPAGSPTTDWQFISV
jgi:hypothetical protein